MVHSTVPLEFAWITQGQSSYIWGRGSLEQSSLTPPFAALNGAPSRKGLMVNGMVIRPRHTTNEYLLPASVSQGAHSQ